jgi:hypothetical protein
MDFQGGDPPPGKSDRFDPRMSLLVADGCGLALDAQKALGTGFAGAQASRIFQV